MGEGSSQAALVLFASVSAIITTAVSLALTKLKQQIRYVASYHVPFTELLGHHSALATEFFRVIRKTNKGLALSWSTLIDNSDDNGDGDHGKTVLQSLR